MYSSCHPPDVLPLIYKGASCNPVVYTVGTSGSVKIQYATLANGLLEEKNRLSQVLKRHIKIEIKTFFKKFQETNKQDDNVEVVT